MDKDYIKNTLAVWYLQGQIIQLYKTRADISSEIVKREKELERQRAITEKVGNGVE
jgi:hypothetical protein|tara:strand:+ start:41 stop:208 length:168 start_codon:yes stop_codon:yes gene_type:complete